jgi:phage tail tape-measure protein
LQSKFNGIGSVVSTAKIAVGSFLGSLASNVFTSAVSGISAFAQSVVTLGARLEQTKVAFTTMLGSAGEADALLRDLTDFAAKTPFEINSIRDTAKQLLAFGFSASEIIPTLKSLGDVSAGLSVPIEQVAYAYGQVRTANQLYGTELRQFVNA